MKKQGARDEGESRVVLDRTPTLTIQLPDGKELAIDPQTVCNRLAEAGVRMDGEASITYPAFRKVVGLPALSDFQTLQLIRAFGEHIERIKKNTPWYRTFADSVSPPALMPSGSDAGSTPTASTPKSDSKPPRA